MRARKRAATQVAGDDLIVEGGVVVSRQGKERPNSFRQQHGEARAIDRYRVRGSITQRQYEAGDRLHCDMVRAGQAPKVTANLLGAGGGGECSYGMASTMAQVAARQRLRNAAAAVGRRLWGILTAVIWEDMAASAWASGEGVRDERHARTAGMITLQVGLDTLADHYGIPYGDDGAHPATPNSSRHP